MARVLRITVDTGFVGATHEDECDLPEDWDSLSSEEQNEFKVDACQTAIQNYIDAYAEVVNDA